jgi:predicted house-cleaning noncanonical NTP pyrophosphatase (MazG superfamily)
MRKQYNKLVRDKIPDIIKAYGQVPVVRILDTEEFPNSLSNKLFEEIQEFLVDNSIEELVDIFEVILAILNDRKIAFSDFEKLRQAKALEKGAFTDRVFLESIIE